MGSDLKTYTVEELVKLGALEKPLDGNHGGIHPKSSEFVAEGIPFIMASDMKNGKVDTRNCKFISEDQARGLRKGFAKEGDVLLSHKATIGRTAIVDSIDTDFIVLTPQVTYYRIKNLGVINPKYLKYYFDSVKFQSLFEQWAGGGSTRLYLGITGQMKLPIELPDIKTQNSIASIISDYDSKLLLNSQTNQTLEQMAQALFKSWFVDFDPVFDNLLASVDFNLENLENCLPDELKQKAQRRLAALNSLENVAQYKASLSALAHELQAQLPTKEATQAAMQVSEKAAKTPVKANFSANPNILAQHANTHAHFPNEFEHNEQLGWIPKGWEVSALSELINIKHGFAYKGEFFSEEKTKDVLLTPGNVKVGGGFKGDKYKYYKGPIIEEYRFNKNDMYVNMTDLSKASDTLGYPAIVPEMDGVIFHHNQRLGKVLYTGAKSAKSGFIYQILCSNNSRNNILASATGTTVKHTSPTKILSLMICHSGGSIESLYEKNAKILSEKLAGNNSNNIELTKLRDTLLPKLISGELQIPNVTTDEEVVD